MVSIWLRFMRTALERPRGVPGSDARPTTLSRGAPARLYASERCRRTPGRAGFCRKGETLPPNPATTARPGDERDPDRSQQQPRTRRFRREDATPRAAGLDPGAHRAVRGVTRAGAPVGRDTV